MVTDDSASRGCARSLARQAHGAAQSRQLRSNPPVSEGARLMRGPDHTTHQRRSKRACVRSGLEREVGILGKHQLSSSTTITPPPRRK